MGVMSTSISVMAHVGPDTKIRAQSGGEGSYVVLKLVDPDDLNGYIAVFFERRADLARLASAVIAGYAALGPAVESGSGPVGSVGAGGAAAEDDDPAWASSGRSVAA